MKTLFVGWQQASNQEWVPVARLERAAQGYQFSYTKGAARAQAFRPFGRMDDLKKIYQSDQLFPLFANRLLARSRPEFQDYLRWTGLPPEALSDPLTILAVTGGLRGTDPIELFPHPERTPEGRLRMEFFARGLRHFAKPNLLAADELTAGDRLFIVRDVQNAHDRFALCLRTQDPVYLVGYCPKYYTRDICKLFELSTDDVRVTVKQVNVDAPLSMRLLCTLDAPWPDNFSPFSDTPDFEPIVSHHFA